MAWYPVQSNNAFYSRRLGPIKEFPYSSGIMDRCFALCAHGPLKVRVENQNETDYRRFRIVDRLKFSQAFCHCRLTDCALQLLCPIASECNTANTAVSPGTHSLSPFRNSLASICQVHSRVRVGHNKSI